MEHLMWDENRVPSLRCPYYSCDAVPAYDGKGFYEYLERQGCSADTIIQEHLHPMPSDKSLYFLCLIQNYAFFGFLDEFLNIFGMQLDVRDFVVVDEDGQRWLSTKSLPGHVRTMALSQAQAAVATVQDTETQTLITADNLVAAPLSVLVYISIRGTTEDIYTSILERTKDLVTTVRSFLELVNNSLGNRSITRVITEQDYLMLFTCSILATSVESIVDWLFPPSRLFDNTILNIGAHGIGQCLHMKTWCPNRTANILSDDCAAAYMLELDSHDARLHAPSGHSITYAADEVSGDNTNLEAAPSTCSERRCLKVKHDNLTMSPTHRCQQQESFCKSIVISETELADVYLRGALPVIQLEQRSSHVLPRVVEYTEGATFCAISHVWSHGLGNSIENSLPLCQVLYICDMVRQALPGPCLFWIDTLCIPVSSAHMAVRKIAVAKMASIYKKATSTIVLDKNLQLVEDDPYAMGLQLLCSEWGRRLWTFQEAVLPGADKLFVCFKAGPVPWNLICNSELSEQSNTRAWARQFLEHAGLPFQQDEQWQSLGGWEAAVFDYILGTDSSSMHGVSPARTWNPLERYIRCQLNVMLGTQGSGLLVGPGSLLKIAKSLCNRATSKPSDEFVCIATLFGSDLSQDHALPLTMDSILTRVPIPEDLLYLQGPRLQRQGFRWAPSTFLGQPWFVVSFECIPATLTPLGLVVRKAAVVLREVLDFENIEAANLTQNGRSLAIWDFLFKAERLKLQNVDTRYVAFILREDITHDTGYELTNAVAVLRRDVTTTTKPIAAQFLFNRILRAPRTFLSTSRIKTVTDVAAEYVETTEWLID